MTNREAIDVVKVLKAVCEETFGEGEVEALQMAIDALEKHETTADTDTVSRQAVIDTVRKIILGFFSDEDGVMTDTEKTLLSVNKAICNGVRELPSAQPELPEWVQKVEEYRKSAPSFVRNQLVWALYQTWKEYDGRLVHQRGKENR